MEDLCILRVVVPCNGFRTKWIRVLSRYGWCPKSMWDEVGDRQLFGPNVIKEWEENVKLLRDRLKVAQSRQKSYVDSKLKEVVYEIGDRACLRVSPLWGVKWFGVKGKLAPRFVGPYRVLERMEKWPTSWSHPEDCQEFKMCFTFPSWRSAMQRWPIFPYKDAWPWKG